MLGPGGTAQTLTSCSEVDSPVRVNHFLWLPIVSSESAFSVLSHSLSFHFSSRAHTSSASLLGAFSSSGLEVVSALSSRALSRFSCCLSSGAPLKSSLGLSSLGVTSVVAPSFGVPPPSNSRVSLR